MWQTNLIRLYCAVCNNSSTIEAVIQRQSNNFRPQFSDEEYIVDSCPIILAKGTRCTHEKVGHDLPAAKQILQDHLPVKHGRLYADKAYIDADWAQFLEENHALSLLTQGNTGRKGQHYSE